MLITRHSAIAVVVTLGAVLAACDRGAPNQTNGDHPNGEALAATPAAARQAVPYTPRTLDAFGRLTGVVELDGAPPPDSVIQPSTDQQVCGTGFTRRGLDVRGNRVAGVVVWIDGVRRGKPLPLERRFEISNDRCLLIPEQQTAIAGGTLNVRNRDALEHRTVVKRLDGGEVVATIRETDEGQVVPNEAILAKPGVLELSCAAHPWTRAWIAVFDYPYFATTGTDGTFAIDSIPTGRHHVRIWHPRLGAAEDSVTIENGQVAAVIFRAKAR